MTVVRMPAGELHPYHKHEQLVQSLAGVNIASEEEIGATLHTAFALVWCLSLHKEAMVHQSRVLPRRPYLQSEVCQLSQSVDMLPAGRHNIRSWMPDQHRSFYATLQIIFVSIRDGEGRPRALALTGPAGFITSPTSTELTIAPQQSLDRGAPVCSNRTLLARQYKSPANQ